MLQVLAVFPRVISRLWTAFWKEAPRHFTDSCRNLIATIEAWLYDSKRALYGIAVARMLFSVAALGLLLTNFSTRHYTYGSGAAWSGQLAQQQGGFADNWLFRSFFAIAGNDMLVTLFFLVMMLLALALLVGFRGRVVLPIFLVLWISMIETPYFAGDQGDNVMRIALFLMLFTDHSARWSFDSKRRARSAGLQGPLHLRLVKGATVLPENLTNLWHNLAIVALACQVCMIYVSGALYKAGGEPWQDGTAVYGPMMTMRFGPWPELNEFITTFAVTVALASVGSVVLQVVFPGALLFRWTRIPALFAMISFHLGIAIFMGLPWFSLAMIAIDAIFIRDVTWQRMGNWIRKSSVDPSTSAKPTIAEKKRAANTASSQETREQVGV